MTRIYLWMIITSIFLMSLNTSTQSINNTIQISVQESFDDDIFNYEGYEIKRWRSGGESWNWTVDDLNYLEIRILGSEMGEQAGYLMKIIPLSSSLRIAVDGWWNLEQTNQSNNVNYVEHIQYIIALNIEFPGVWNEFLVSPTEQDYSSCYDNFEDMRLWCSGSVTYTDLKPDTPYYLVLALQDLDADSDDNQVVRFRNIHISSLNDSIFSEDNAFTSREATLTKSSGKGSIPNFFYLVVSIIIVAGIFFYKSNYSKSKPTIQSKHKQARNEIRRAGSKKVLCSSCGTINLTDSSYCMECGTYIGI